MIQEQIRDLKHYYSYIIENIPHGWGTQAVCAVIQPGAQCFPFPLLTGGVVVDVLKWRISTTNYISQTMWNKHDG